ncbi:VOC family protein [Streptomyces sp. NBC_01795]|nr:VOC family protein [Streptomyces sp. NBC_01795]WSB80337.1 VOC family protein [Streptomyces sp. NBC_01775]WSS11452.1 VOC family protein [Streptomyces sp. NBC_01186]WSS40166.1 VOC family protein [Streptomyces sp. NBC_01187]
MASVGGVPCWVSLMTPDPRAAEDFYGPVLSWSFEPSSDGPDSRVATVDGQPVAGVSELSAGADQGSERWTVYFHVRDADLVAERIAERGATVAVGPLRTGGGRAVIAADQAGAPFGLWQGERPASWAVGSGRAPAWLQLHTRDAFAAAVFYGEIFDWMGDPRHGVTYEEEYEEIVIRVEGHPVAGVRGGSLEAPPDPRIRSRWEPYFRVPDLDAAVSAAEREGGETVSPPRAAPLGRTATLRDPKGASFCLLST